MIDSPTALIETLRIASGGPGLRYAEPPGQLTGGFYAEMLRFRLDDPPAGLEGDLVARIVPNAEMGAWEAALQGAVARAGFPTAAVRLTVGDDSPIGRYLIVMDFIAGRSPLDELRLSRMLRDAPRLARTLPRTLAHVSAQLHALDPAPVDAALDALHSSIPRTSTDFVAALLARAEELRDDELTGAAQRLLADAPPATTLVVCHGDLHPFNVLVRADGLTLLDWSVARVAHPAYDLAFTDLMLRHPPIGVPAPLRGPLGAFTRRLADRFLREYASLTSDASTALDPAAFAWHRRMHALRSLIELAGWRVASHEPHGHPWISLEPTARQVLGLPPRHRARRDAQV